MDFVHNPKAVELEWPILKLERADAERFGTAEESTKSLSKLEELGVEEEISIELRTSLENDLHYMNLNVSNLSLEAVLDVHVVL